MSGRVSECGDCAFASKDMNLQLTQVRAHIFQAWIASGGVSERVSVSEGVSVSDGVGVSEVSDVYRQFVAVGGPWGHARVVASTRSAGRGGRQ